MVSPDVKSDQSVGDRSSIFSRLVKDGIVGSCASNFPKSSADFGLAVPNGSYAITAGHCVQCSCGPGNLNLYCQPASLAVSCSSMQCKSSNLMVGNVTAQPSGGGCNVNSCTYGGIVNGSIVATLSSTLQPRCPGPHQFPPLIAPTDLTVRDSLFAPAPAPSQEGVTPKNPGSVILPGAGLGPGGLSPANGPTGSISAAPLVIPLSRYQTGILLLGVLVVLTTY
ncbi:hypothetical protein MKW94_018489 [Papaver nudicaule]|uniref:Uncharacterized protein n=1 Tax=Papaver nudicaule TaxID=74823 RepID=A0AA41SID6_PAPNU|nr:hypothetical protein [Papaver nudicaule]